MAAHNNTTLADMLSRHATTAADELVTIITASGTPPSVQCHACAHECTISPGRRGICNMRTNVDGQLRVPRGYVAGLGADPIEKKPFFHVMPGCQALSYGMLGCNFRCPFCQNWCSSQTLRDDQATARPSPVDPDELIAHARRQDIPILCSTYNEPLITSEWSVELMQLAGEHGIVGAYVSNGFATPQVLEYIRPYVHMCNVDLKCFTEAGYRHLGGALQPVLDTIRRLWDMAFWVEVVSLIVPDFNDSEEELQQMAEFVAGVSPDIPWHVTAFHPDYHASSTRSTPPETLIQAHDIGRRAGLHYVYLGNMRIQGGHYEDTQCPGCGSIVIERSGYHVRSNRLRDGLCPDCGHEVKGYWNICT